MSLASGSLAMVSWYLIDLACFSLISAESRSPTMRWGSCWRLTAVAMISSKAAFMPYSLGSPMRSKICVRSIRWSSGGCRTGTIGDRRMTKRQCGRRHDVGRASGFALPGQDVEHHIGGMNAVTERFGAGGFHRGKAVGQNHVEDIDHLPIAVIGVGEL